MTDQPRRETPLERRARIRAERPIEDFLFQRRLRGGVGPDFHKQLEELDHGLGGDSIDWKWERE